ncbi:hypothetical protein JCM8547_004263 [Rhodosporidiobolus lusitaniae]
MSLSERWSIKISPDKAEQSDVLVEATKALAEGAREGFAELKECEVDALQSLVKLHFDGPADQDYIAELAGTWDSSTVYPF